jgi:hypothetical protein
MAGWWVFVGGFIGFFWCFVMGEFGGVFIADERGIHGKFVLVGACEGSIFVVVTVGGVVSRCFVAGTFDVFIFEEGDVVLAVTGIFIGGFLAGYAVGLAICRASLWNAVVVVILVSVGALFLQFKGG